MYLETILLLSKKKPYVRSCDIVEELGYVKSSVSAAVKNLKDKGYLTVDGDNVLKLTPSGKAHAESVYERHTVLTELLISVGADRALAEENACRIEHVISDELFSVIKEYVKNRI